MNGLTFSDYISLAGIAMIAPHVPPMAGVCIGVAAVVASVVFALIESNK